MNERLPISGRVFGPGGKFFGIHKYQHNDISVTLIRYNVKVIMVLYYLENIEIKRFLIIC